MTSNVIPIASRTVADFTLQQVMEVLDQYRQNSDFIDSLCTQWDAGRGLSLKQEIWARKLAQERMDAGERDATPLLDLAPLYGALMEAEARVVRMLDDKGRKLALSKAPRREAFYVKVDKTYVGAIPADGRLRPAPGSSRFDLPCVTKALSEAAYDLHGAMVRYGHATGECGVCGRLLTDPESVAAGIGPVCAGKVRR